MHRGPPWICQQSVDVALQTGLPFAYEIRSHVAEPLFRGERSNVKVGIDATEFGVQLVKFFVAPLTLPGFATHTDLEEIFRVVGYFDGRDEGDLEEVGGEASGGHFLSILFTFYQM